MLRDESGGGARSEEGGYLAVEGPCLLELADWGCRVGEREGARREEDGRVVLFFEEVGG